MSSPITQEAVRIIESAPAHGPLWPEAYAKALPPQAATLARVLVQKAIVEAAKKYQEADRRAIRAQSRFYWMGKTAAYSGFLAAVIGGLLLYMGADPSTETIRLIFGFLQFVLLAVSLLGSLALYTLKPFRTWRQQRGEAEGERLRVFALIMSDRSRAGDDEVPLPALRLECFRRHLLDDQTAFFKRRGPEHRRSARLWNVLRALALLMIVAASLPLLTRLEAFGWPPEFLRDLVNWLALKSGGAQQAYALAGLIGASLQGLLAALAVISLADRNADKYEKLAERLDMYSNVMLARARAEAAAGNGAAVGEFTRQVASELAGEASEWVALQEALAEMTIEWLTPHHKISP